MTPQEKSKSDFLENLALVRRTYAGIAARTGADREFSSRQRWILVEGLFMNSWSCWEQLLQQLLVADLATAVEGTIGKFAGTGNSLQSRIELAEHILYHPDHPSLHVNWDFDHVEARARKHLPRENRFENDLPRIVAIQYLKRMRNVVAHRSESARESFLALIQGSPFSLDARQGRKLTVGEFLTEHAWPVNTESGIRSDGVFSESIRVLEECANSLDP